MEIKGKIAATVVTYNRLDLLKKVVESLENQTRKPDAIFVIDNSSTDGTAEWLKGKDNIRVITQDNTGSSGGQYTSIRAAYEAGFDWIWVMDDDVVPDAGALEILASDDDEGLVRTTFRTAHDGNPYINDTLEFNLSNPFKSIWKRIITKKDLSKKFIDAEGITFEGPMFHRSLVEKIGLPEYKFFIFGDDSEYFIRAKKAGFRIQVFMEAGMKRLLPGPSENQKFDWKNYYMIRNIIAIDVLHAPFAVRLIRPFGYLFSWLSRCRSFRDIFVTLKAFFHGYFYKRAPENINDPVLNNNKVN